MADQTVIHNTFVVERNYPAKPERVFAVFQDPAKKRRWFAVGEHHDIEEYTMDFRVGGAEHSLYRFKPGTMFPGVPLEANGFLLDIVPGERIVSSSTMAIGGKRISASLVTIELLAAGEGTTLICTHQAAFFEGADGPEMRKAGWEKLLDKLGNEFTA